MAHRCVCCGLAGSRMDLALHFPEYVLEIKIDSIGEEHVEFSQNQWIHIPVRKKEFILVCARNVGEVIRIKCKLDYRIYFKYASFPINKL